MWKAIVRAKNHICNHHQQLANYFICLGSIVALVGVLLTFLSLKNSADNLKIQLKEQERATAVLIVNDFLNEIGSGILEKRHKDDDLKEEFVQVVITRTEVLLDTLNFPDLSAQVIKFLAMNDLYELFQGNETGSVNKRFISLRNLKLQNAVLEGLNFSKVNLTCADLTGIRLDHSACNEITMFCTDLSDSFLNDIDLSDSKIQYVNFNGAFISEGKLENATIVFSDLRNIRATMDPYMTKENKVEKIVEILKDVKSLYGSILDDDVKIELQKKIDSDSTQKRNFNIVMNDVDNLIRNNEDKNSRDDLEKPKEEVKKFRDELEKRKEESLKNWDHFWKSEKEKVCRR